jgi:hypothetical protein
VERILKLLTLMASLAVREQLGNETAKKFTAVALV